MVDMGFHPIPHLIIMIGQCKIYHSRGGRTAPDWRECRICQSRTRRCQPFCQSAHARTGRACRKTASVCRARRLLWKAHPNDGEARLVRAARAAENRFIRGSILSQSVPTARSATPDCRSGATYQNCTRRRYPFCQKVQARTFSAYRTDYLFTLPYCPRKGVWGETP